jgi:hypothetical protein
MELSIFLTHLLSSTQIQMFQLQMTGYMFKNAEYRLSMSQSLGMYQDISSNLLLSGGQEELLDKDDDPLVSGKIKGKLKIRYGKKKDESNKDKTTQTKPTNEAEENDKVDSSTSSSETAEDEDGGMEIEVDAAAYMSELRFRRNEGNQRRSSSKRFTALHPYITRTRIKIPYKYYEPRCIGLYEGFSSSCPGGDRRWENRSRYSNRTVG